jgi:hypothetical protein
VCFFPILPHLSPTHVCYVNEDVLLHHILQTEFIYSTLGAIISCIPCWNKIFVVVKIWLYWYCRGASAGNCNGGRNHNETFCYGNSNGDPGREADVQACFDKLSNPGNNFGCRIESQGNCQCTVDSSFIWNWSQTFGGARKNLYQQCHGFTNNILERYEGNMYLTATCN